MQTQRLAAIAAAVALVAASTAQAQENAVGGTAGATAANAPGIAVAYVDDGLPFGASTVTNGDAASVKMPELAFTPDVEDAGNYDKYYYFYRTGTDFATAYADIRECDGYARGLQSGIGYVQTPYPYSGTMAGALGGMIGNALAAAIFGSGEKRRLRRVNMRACMNFKGYERHGLSKKLWVEFNFEEGLSGVEEKDRLRMLKQQALIASSAQPAGKALGL